MRNLVIATSMLSALALAVPALAQEAGIASVWALERALEWALERAPRPAPVRMERLVLA